MKKIILVALSLMLASAAMAQETFPSFVNVTGKAEREITPNEIYVNITIDESTSKGKVSVADQERQMIAALKKLNINTDKDLQVGDLSGDLETYVLRKDRTYTTKTYSLKVKDANTLSKVFSALADINISKANVTKATRSDMDQIRSELRVEAMKNAQASAKELAGAVGQSVGKAFQINEYNYNEPVYYADSAYPMQVRAAGMAKNESDSSLEFKSLKVTHTVNVQFVLE